MAKSELELILKKAPKDRDTLLDYMTVLSQLQLEDLPILDQLVKFYPNDPTVIFILAKVQLQEGKVAIGHENWLRAISLSNSAEQFRLFLGDADLVYGIPIVIFRQRFAKQAKNFLKNMSGMLQKKRIG